MLYHEKIRLRYTTLYYIPLYCIILYCIVLYCIVLYCIVSYCVVLYCSGLHRIVLYCVVLYCSLLYCIYSIVLCYVILLHLVFYTYTFRTQAGTYVYTQCTVIQSISVDLSWNYLFLPPNRYVPRMTSQSINFGRPASGKGFPDTIRHYPLK